MNSLDNLRHYNVKRCNTAFPTHDLHSWSPTDWACALAGEVGELCNKIKKQRRGDTIATKEIADELADVIIYADLLAARLGIDLHDAIVSKFNEVSDRVGSPIKIPH